MTGNEPEIRTRDPLASVLIAVLALVMLLAGVIAFLTGSSLIFPSIWWRGLWNLNPAARVAFQTLGDETPYVLLAVAALCVCSGLGLFWRRKWAWWAAIVLFGLNTVGDLIRLLATHEYARYGAGMVIAICFLVLLTLPGVRGQMR